MAKTQEKAPQDGADQQEKAATTATKKATVVTEFRDKDNFDTVYEKGDTVEFTEKRITDLVSLGLVKVEEPADPATGGGEGDPK